MIPTFVESPKYEQDNKTFSKLNKIISKKMNSSIIKIKEMENDDGTPCQRLSLKDRE